MDRQTKKLKYLNVFEYWKIYCLDERLVQTMEVNFSDCSTDLKSTSEVTESKIFGGGQGTLLQNNRKGGTKFSDHFRAKSLESSIGRRVLNTGMIEFVSLEPVSLVRNQFHW